MLVNQPGRVTSKIILLGRTESCVYLLDGGSEYAIMGGGMSYIGPDVVSQLDSYGIDPEKIKYLVIHHTHFDHVGLAPFLSRKWPWIKIIASEKGKSQLARPEVMQSIRDLNRILLEQKGMADKAGELGLDLETIRVDLSVKDGQTMPLGNLTLRFIDTPGHSSCSLTVYVPEEKAVFASDAGGIPFKDQIFTSANSNFDLYQQSLEKMAELDVEVYLCEHNGAFTGTEGSNFIQKSIEAAKVIRKTLEDICSRNQDEQEAAREFSELLLGEVENYFLPNEVVILVAGQMVHYMTKKQAGLIKT